MQKVFVQDKAIFAEEDDSQEFRNFVNKIKNSVECFRKRLEVTKLEYEKLVEKKKERQISASEEDRFIYLYKVLSSYDYVDKMPDILVRNSTQDTLEDMLATLKEFKQCLRRSKTVYRVHGDKVIRRRTNYRKENDIQKYTKILKKIWKYVWILWERF